MPYSLTDMALYFFMYSFCGWLMETILCSVQERRFINRGFLNGPLCPIYGCGVTLIMIFLLPVRDGLPNLAIALPVVFIAGAGLASAGEFITSWLMEKLFHARWWDYSHYKYNLGGRICLSISLAWGGLATFFVYIVQPLFESLVGNLYGWNAHLPLVLAVTFTVLFLVDCAFSVRIARSLGNKLEQMEKLGELIKAHLEGLELPAAEDVELKLQAAYDRYAARKQEAAASLRGKLDGLRGLGREDVADRLRHMAEELQAKRTGLMQQVKPTQKRMLSAFPTMKRGGDGRVLSELREHLHIRKKK